MSYDDLRSELADIKRRLRALETTPSNRSSTTINQLRARADAAQAAADKANTDLVAQKAYSDSIANVARDGQARANAAQASADAANAGLVAQRNYSDAIANVARDAQARANNAQASANQAQATANQAMAQGNAQYATLSRLIANLQRKFPGDNWTAGA